MAKALPIALLSLACVLLAGCGGSSAGPDGGSRAGADVKRLSAGQLAAQGTAICNQAIAAERAAQTANTTAALPPIVTREVAQLHRLSSPASEQSSYAALLDKFSQLDALLTRLFAAVARTGKAPSAILDHGREVAAQAATLAGPLGLAACTSAQ
jgi:hypothetical protein